jgi:hypothetical protein
VVGYPRAGIPHLAKVARDYAGIPGSSVPSERVFSRAGDLITKKRNRLAPESADSIICLRYWLGLPEITEDEITRFEGSQEEGQEHEFLVDHYLPEDDGPGNEDAGVLDITGLLEDIDEDMGTLVVEPEDITSSLNAGTGSQQR